MVYSIEIVVSPTPKTIFPITSYGVYEQSYQLISKLASIKTFKSAPANNSIIIKNLYKILVKLNNYHKKENIKIYAWNQTIETLCL